MPSMPSIPSLSSIYQQEITIRKAMKIIKQISHYCAICKTLYLKNSYDISYCQECKGHVCTKCDCSKFHINIEDLLLDDEVGHGSKKKTSNKLKKGNSSIIEDSKTNEGTNANGTASGKNTINNKKKKLKQKAKKALAFQTNPAAISEGNDATDLIEMNPLETKESNQKEEMGIDNDVEGPDEELDEEEEMEANHEKAENVALSTIKKDREGDDNVSQTSRTKSLSAAQQAKNSMAIFQDSAVNRNRPATREESSDPVVLPKDQQNTYSQVSSSNKASVIARNEPKSPNSDESGWAQVTSSNNHKNKKQSNSIQSHESIISSNSSSTTSNQVKSKGYGNSNNIAGANTNNTTSATIKKGKDINTIPTTSSQNSSTMNKRSQQTGTNTVTSASNPVKNSTTSSVSIQVRKVDGNC